MMQAIFETCFDVVYLIGVITAGIIMLTKGGGNSLVKKFGIMSVVLGAGDAFHLVPRMYALWTTGLEANAAALGIGKLITSITMTVFYLILYYIWRGHYQIQEKKALSITIWCLTLVRILLCLLPQNEWLSANPPLLYGIVRNIPFAAMGILIIVIFEQERRRTKDTVFRFLPIAVLLSFGFYIPVVLFSAAVPMLGMLMIPKTLAYVWVVSMGWMLYKKDSQKNRKNY